MDKLLILQSTRPNPAWWIERCLATVEEWAERQSIKRLFIGDELFDPLPKEWLEAAGPAKLPATDYARLLWIERLLEEGHEQVIWLDADILMLDRDFMPPAEDFFCRELWVYRRPDGRDFAIDAVNNCAMSFLANSPLLDWYLRACADAPRSGPLPPLALGPNVLRARHRKSPLPWTEAIPTLSPRMIRGMMRGDRQLMQTFLMEWDAPIAAAHLCSSLTTDEPRNVPGVPESMMDAAIDKLLEGSLRRETYRFHRRSADQRPGGAGSLTSK